MKINVGKVAKLANLQLTPQEEKKYGEQLAKILDYVEKLNEVDTSGVEPTCNVTSTSNVMAKDEPQECLFQEEAISNAPRKKDGFIVSKSIFKDS